MPRFSIIGEVLFDQFPDGSRILGGAPFNVAWHLQALGQAPRFISRIGNDAEGRQIQQAMHDWGLDTGALQIDSHHPTGAVTVRFEQGEPQFSILPHQAYDFIDATALPTSDSDWLYHGSLALRHADSANAITQLRQAHRGHVLIDINVRQPWWSLDRLAPYLAAADWLKLNQAEIAALLPQPMALHSAMQALIDQYSLTGVVVTQGEHGASALTADGDWQQVQPPSTVTVVDTVGAGDAFAAVLLVGLQQQWPLEQVLQRAQTFASAIVGQRGATVAHPDFYHAIACDWLLSRADHTK